MQKTSLSSAAKLIECFDFANDCVSLPIGKLANSFLLRQKLDQKSAALISNEIEDIQQQVLRFSNGSFNPATYLNLLYGLSQNLSEISVEAELLETLIPFWQAERGTVIAKDKPIDEFYYEFEMLNLWVLISKSIQGENFTPAAIFKMRTIIRRYSNMPSFWLYLWDISGEEVKTGYTF